VTYSLFIWPAHTLSLYRAYHPPHSSCVLHFFLYQTAVLSWLGFTHIPTGLHCSCIWVHLILKMEAARSKTTTWIFTTVQTLSLATSENGSSDYLTSNSKGIITTTWRGCTFVTAQKAPKSLLSNLWRKQGILLSGRHKSNRLEVKEITLSNSFISCKQNLNPVTKWELYEASPVLNFFKQILILFQNFHPANYFPQRYIKSGQGSILGLVCLHAKNVGLQSFYVKLKFICSTRFNLYLFESWSFFETECQLKGTRERVFTNKLD
jgi:hypothetical protein